MSVVRAEAVAVAKGGRAILDGVAIDVAAGEVVGLIGPNGAGKTTLMRVLCRLQRPDSGAVFIAGDDAREIDRRRLARTVAYFAQGAECHWPLTVERVVALGRLPHFGPWQRPGAGDARAVAEAMREADVAALGARPLDTLSGGERARVLLARALAVEAPAILADEPVAQLDSYHQLQIMEVFRRRASTGAAVVVVLHDLSLAARFCDRLVLLCAGRSIATGAPDHVLAPTNLEAAYAIRAVHGSFEGVPFIVPWARADAATGDAPR